MAVIGEADLLSGQGSTAVVEPVPEDPEFNRVRHPLPTNPPLVSVLVCTCDHERHLRIAVAPLVSRTTSPRYEIVIVDNGSVDPGAVAHLMELAVIQQELSAVTAACLVVRTEVFWSVSGLDERLEVAFNDVHFRIDEPAARARAA